MARMILLPTTFIFLAEITAAKIPPMPKPTALQSFIIELQKQYQDYGLNGTYKELQQAWAHVTKAGQNHSSSELNDLQQFLNKIVEDYGKDAAKRAYKDLDEEWDHYTKVFGKEYAPEENEKRKAIFKKNREEMKKHNELFKQGNVSYSLNMNHFSDWTPEELKMMKRAILPNTAHHSDHYAHPRTVRETTIRYGNYSYDRHSEIPAFVDWRTKSYVTHVKYQGDCNACYAFAGIGALEGYHAKKTGKLISLSEQNILDCTWNLDNLGCNGGYPFVVFQYAQMHGVISENQYPYEMRAAHNCRWRSEHVIAKDEGYLAVPGGDELALQHAVANYGPVAAFIATTNSFEAYGSGIYNPGQCRILNHAVLIVGYGTDPKLGDYWIAKNSYGSCWGEQGYIRIARNRNNVCYVASYAEFPI